MNHSSLAVLLMVFGLYSLGGCQAETYKDEQAIELGQILGTVTYHERIALPPDGFIYIKLEDMTSQNPADAVVAEVILRSDRQVPVPFTLQYNPECINSRHHYEMRAEIRDADNRLLWTNHQHYGVLTHGHHPNSGVEIMVQPVGAEES